MKQTVKRQMFRFLHLADVHLDTTFLCRTSELRSRMRDALRVSFRRAVDCAIEESVHAVLIAGDLFDNDRLSFATERFLIEEFRRLHEAGISCYYVSGNHDPGGQTFRSGRIEWPESFHRIGGGSPESFTVTDSSGNTLARIMAVGHSTAREETNLARQFPVVTDRLPHVGLLHTYVTSASQAETHDRYAPCALEDLRRTGYRYWALGHIHRRQRVCDVSEAWYPGNLQGRNPRETGAKGGLLVSLGDSGPPLVEFRPFAPLEWAEIDLDDLDGVFTLSDLERRAREAFEAMSSGSAGTSDWLLRLTLRGPSPLADLLRDDAERADLETVFTSKLGAVDVEVRVRGVVQPVDVAAHRGEPHVLGVVLELLDAAIEDPDLRSSLAPEVMAKEYTTPEERDRYLRELLTGLDGEAAARLIRNE